MSIPSEYFTQTFEKESRDRRKFRNPVKYIKTLMKKIPKYL